MGFFDKLKIGAEKEPEQEEKTKKPADGPAAKRTRQNAKSSAVKTKITPVTDKEEVEAIGEKIKEQLPKKSKEADSDFEGELAIDVYETDADFVVQSTIAGVKAEDLDITIENDIVTVKGSREKQVSEETKKYYYQECYWGTFSRQVILPEEVDGSKAEAAIKDGVLTLRIPKVVKIQKRKISIKQES
ncbi:MAG: Hsp20/alpha crystallin family protein [Candidatus Nealsonbacteria bacterium]|nr:Hsp20/alpha crystallin family protein [Candidatus Nealsonbacteria bacterium]